MVNYSDGDFSFQRDKSFPHNRILVIANCQNPAVNYINLLRYLKYDIFWVGENVQGGPGLNLTNPVYEHIQNEYPEFGPILRLEHRFSLRGLLEFLGMDFSLILHFQNWWYPIDRDKSPVPYIYIPSEAWYPKIPFCAHYSTYSCMAMKELIQKYHPNIPLIGYLPYPLNVWLEKPIEKEPTHKLGFTGNLHAFKELYEERREICFWLKYQTKKKDVALNWPDADRIGPFQGKIQKEGKGLISAEEYRDFLVDCEFGLSIPTILGPPFRDLEIISQKRVLVTKKTRDMENMGFIEGIHYKAYDKKEEILEIIEKVDDNERKCMVNSAYNVLHMAHLAIHRTPQLEMIFESFGIFPHGKAIGLWKELKRDSNGVFVGFNNNPSLQKEFTHCIYIGENSYFPITMRDFNEKVCKPDNCEGRSTPL